MAKMRSSRVVCKVGFTTSWLLRVVSSPSVCQHVGALDARRPDPQIGFDQLARFGDHAFGGGFHHLLAGDHPHAQRFQLLVRRLGQLFRQRRQDARPRLDQGHLQPAFVEHFQAVMTQLGGGIVELGRQFHAGGAAADNIHPHHGVGVGILAQGARDPQAMIQQLGAEAVGLQPAVQEDAMLRHALGAEIVAAPNPPPAPDSRSGCGGGP